MELIKEIMKAENDQEVLKQKMNNDKAYIKLLHDYNYLKVRLIRRNNENKYRMYAFN